MRKLLLLSSLLIFSLLTHAQRPTKLGDYKQYITKNNDTVRVGDTITLGLPRNGDRYVFITQGNEPAAAHISGNDVVITKIKSYGNNKKGYKMYAIFRGYGLLNVLIDIDNAIKTEEIEL